MIYLVCSITAGGLEPLDDVKDEEFHYKWVSNTLVQVIFNFSYPYGKVRQSVCLFICLYQKILLIP